MAKAQHEGLDGSWTEALDRVGRFVAARIGDPELAADITQDVVMRSIASGALTRAENPVAYLFRSARNAVIDHYRTRRVHQPLDDVVRRSEPEAVDDGPNDATRELARCLPTMLDELSPISREALRRVDIDGETQRRVAEELGISVSGMKARVQRARRQLRGLLERCCSVGFDRTGTVATYQPVAPRCGCGADARSSSSV